MLEALRLLDVGERVGGACDAVLTLWPRTRGVDEASDVVMAPEGCYMWKLRQGRHSINKIKTAVLVCLLVEV